MHLILLLALLIFPLHDRNVVAQPTHRNLDADVSESFAIRYAGSISVKPALVSASRAAALVDHPTQNIDVASLEVLFDGVPEQGGGWVLTITLEATIDLRKAEIWVEKSKGLAVKSGSLFWHGTLKSGDEAVIEISFTLTGPLPQDLTVNFVGYTPTGERFEQKVHRNVKRLFRRL